MLCHRLSFGKNNQTAGGVLSRPGMEEKNMASSMINRGTLNGWFDRLLVRHMGEIRFACLLRTLVVTGFAALFLAGCGEDPRGDVPGLSPIPEDHYSWDEIEMGNIAQGVEMARRTVKAPEATACDTDFLEDTLSIDIAANDMYDRLISYGGSDSELTNIKTALEKRLSKREEIVTKLAQELRKSSNDVLGLFSEERLQAYKQYCNGAPKAPRTDSGISYTEILSDILSFPEDAAACQPPLNIAKEAPPAPSPAPVKGTGIAKTNGKAKVKAPPTPPPVEPTPEVEETPPAVPPIVPF